MKLYKLLKMVGDHGVSVFPPEAQELPDPPELAGDPWADNFRKLRFLGFTDYQAGHALKAWAYHAKHDLHQGAAGIRRFVELCVRESAAQQVPPQPIVWGLILLVAVIVAVALGLFLWVYLDKELNVTFGSHEWAYVMSYEERLWIGEILFVSAKQEGVYERGPCFGDVVSSQDRGRSKVGGRDWIWFKKWSVVLKGRRIIFYHVYNFTGFYLRFLGVLTNLGAGRYRLREGGYDGHKPTGLWLRPGGRWGTPKYEGCWGEWWWL